MKIYAPNGKATGMYASVMFRNGVGETDNPALLKWFKKHGYKIDVRERVESVPATRNTISKVKELPENIEEMAPVEIKDWAKSNGLGPIIGRIRNKQALIDTLKRYVENVNS